MVQKLMVWSWVSVMAGAPHHMEPHEMEILFLHFYCIGGGIGHLLGTARAL